MNTATMRVLVLAGWCMWLVVGCDRAPQGYTVDLPEDDDVPRVRIVSLAPVLTKMLVDMGWSSLIVGTADNDAAAPERLPIVGTYTDVNSEALMALRPTHVMMMTGKEGVPSVVQQLSDAGRFELITYPTPTSIAEMTLILSDPSELLVSGAGSSERKSIGAIFGDPTNAFEFTTGLYAQLAQLNEATDGVDKPRVLMVIETNPIMASGPDTVHDQLLDHAGGRNAAAGASVSAPVFDREKLIEANPDVILLLLPDAPDLMPIDQDPRLTELQGLPIPAVQMNRIVMINDPLVQVPSTNLPAIGIQMAKSIHPELSDKIDEITSIVAIPDDAESSSVSASPVVEGSIGD